MKKPVADVLVLSSAAMDYASAYAIQHAAYHEGRVAFLANRCLPDTSRQKILEERIVRGDFVQVWLYGEVISVEMAHLSILATKQGATIVAKNPDLEAQFSKLI